ncbi:hypothetical protein [Prosthecobacter sp.]|uniref:hypothetical protein n=1 Tax=Prosthecobacter sp. TaxID=1965333 RepID=UPI002486D1CD|nr:hypothetical protein [Prosthecobacter sp.]MDI1315364.1 hypothetical protein [Prosthecobacter sp.]
MSELSPASEPAHAQRTPWWQWPHVLSLEVPVVAVLWQEALAQAHGIRLTPLLNVGLGLACWVIYLLDRTLETLAVTSSAGMDVSGLFYHRHRRVLLLGVIPLVMLLLGWMALYVIPEGVLWQAVSLALLVALYLASWSTQGSRVSRDVFISCAGLGGIMLISRMPITSGTKFTLSVFVLGVMALSFLRQLDIRMGNVLPKEMTAALLFAMGCTTSTRFFAMPETITEPVLECVLLTLLFACNLRGITCREAGLKEDGKHSPLVLGTLLFTLAVLWGIELGMVEHTLQGPARVALGAVVLHALVHGARRRFSVDAYRVLADLALIVPLPLAWMR